jgi:hypothetical protein
MRRLSKSKLLAYRQCPKRLWLEIHRPELKEVDADSQMRLAEGHRVGEVARVLFDPEGLSELVDINAVGFDGAFELTKRLIGERRPIFEAAFEAEGALALADVLLPDPSAGGSTWRMVEIKSTTSVKDYQRDDVAIQAYVAMAAGLSLSGIALGHINNQWECPGDGSYDGLFVECDLTSEAFSRTSEVASWIEDGQRIAAMPEPPTVRTGPHCKAPFDCGFRAHCQSHEPAAQKPADWLPRPSKALKETIASLGIAEMEAIPDELLNSEQLRVKECTLSGSPYFDKAGAKAALEPYPLPAYFLDFETIALVIPTWKGVRPYQAVPFQFSVQCVEEGGSISETPFLDLSGSDPSERCARALVEACGRHGPVYVYNQSFEKRILKELADRVPSSAKELMAIHERVVDLLPIARSFYYHPSQQGSWSIKRVLPALFPGVGYEQLDGVKDGGMAMAAYVEAIDPNTSTDRRNDIARQLLAYCAMDTLATVKLWAHFLGRSL